MDMGGTSVEVEVDEDPAALYGDSDGGAEAAGVDMALAMALPLPLDAATAASHGVRAGGASPAAAAAAAAAAGGHRGAPTSMNASAVYRWYDIEEGFHLKRKEESAIAKCKTCQQQGKVERKTLVRFSKSVTSNLWRHLKENHPEVYDKHAGEKKSVQMHQLVGAKKRARKKKAATGADADKLLAAPEDDPVPSSDASSPLATRKLAKKQKRSDPFFDDYQLPTPGSAAGGLQPHPLGGRQPASNAAGGSFNPEKVREAIGYLCLVEMLPFTVCSSHAFRTLLAECAGGAGGFLDEAHSFAIFGHEIACGYAKKLAAEVKARVGLQMKLTDFAHLMLAEWSASSSSSRLLGTHPSSSALSLAAATATTPELDPGSCATRFLALFAVGLDQEFNAFRRCLHVLPVGPHRGAAGAELLRDDEAKKALERVAPCKYMPQVLAVDPPSHDFLPFCAAHKLASLESVTSLLQTIMLATLHGVSITDAFSLNGAVLGPQLVGLGDRRLDGGEFIEGPAALADDFYELPEAEVPTGILEELPAALTGHTLRDLMLKVMYLLAHLKQSRRSRKVLQKIALEELGTSRVLYERVFVAGLRDTPVSLARIYPVLALAFEMMAALKRYFRAHKDGHSDFSKLVQLAALSPYEWARIAHLKTILKPFADATEKLEAERYVIASLVIPSVSTLLGKLRDTRPPHAAAAAAAPSGKRGGAAHDDDELPEDIVALKDAAYANLSTSFGYLFLAPEADWSGAKRQTFHLLWAATLLDPRTRPFIIKGPLSPLELWDVVKVEAATIAGTKAKDDKESGSDALAEAAMALDDDSGQLDGSDGKAAGDLWDDLQANLTSCAQEEMLLSAAKSSLEMAKSSNLLEVEVSFFQEEPHISLRASPLEWWQSMRLKYPFLARLARYVLSIPLSVRVEENPVAADSGLVRRARAEMGLPDLCDLLAASMNLRTEKSSLFEAANKPMWSTV